MRDIGRDKFRYYVACSACQFLTQLARTESIAAKLWNEAKPAREDQQKRGKMRRNPPLGSVEIEVRPLRLAQLARAHEEKPCEL